MAVNKIHFLAVCPWQGAKPAVPQNLLS